MKGNKFHTQDHRGLGDGDFNKLKQKGCEMEISIKYICGRNGYLCPECKPKTPTVSLKQK